MAGIAPTSHSGWCLRALSVNLVAVLSPNHLSQNVRGHSVPLDPAAERFILLSLILCFEGDGLVSAQAVFCRYSGAMVLAAVLGCCCTRPPTHGSRSPSPFFHGFSVCGVHVLSW